MKPFVFIGSSLIIIAVSVSAAAFIGKKEKLPAKHVEVVLRDVGHQLLLSAKDSSSRVMPVKKINEHTYQLSFQNEFGFVSDSLINLVQRSFEKHGLAKDYIVNLRNCQQNETVFAFEINSQKGDLTPCRGRNLELGCYVVEIELLKNNNFNYLWLLLVLPLGVAGYYVSDKLRAKNRKQPADTQAPLPDGKDFIPLGNLKFYPGDNILKCGDNSIPLSEKETKALHIFAQNINQVVDREKLMKEIWEDEGIVVISRNVDVLVSKLRKKLSDDDSLKFVNVHGRGYKFVVG